MIKYILVLISFTISIFSFSQEITIESIWKKGEFYAKYAQGFNTLNDGLHYTELSADKNGSTEIIKKRIDNVNDQGLVMVSSDLLKYKGESLQIDDYQFNADETKLLLMTNHQSIYRRSYSAFYYLLDLNTKKLEMLDAKRPTQTLAEYAPDGKSIAYVYKNDIYVKDLAKGSIRKMTFDGHPNEVINGTTDWVYEEEFGITKAFYWSPDSKKIAFLKFDENLVREFRIDYFVDSLYPEKLKYKYPKAGESNSIVTAHLMDVKSGKSKKIDLGEYEYIPRLSWANKSNKLILQTLNRHQNHLKYHLLDVTNKKAQVKVFYEEKSETYVEIDNNFSVLNDDQSFLRTSELDGRNHIYRIYFDGKSQQITKGAFDVIELYGIDNENQYLYYASAEPSAISKAVFKINIDGKEKLALSPLKGYNNADFAKGLKYFVLSSADANTPPTFTLCDNNGKSIKLLEDNEVLKNKLKNYTLSPKVFTTFSFGDYTLNASIINPVNFDPSKKYPVYMTVYGGPGSNMVTNDWDGNDYMYHQLLAQKGYFVVSVDPRGTMYQGEKFKKCTYLQLGKYEIEDVILTAKELQKLPYIDASRIGIMGWSYGGFMASLAITKGADVFKTAIAVAPVTNWKYYDNIYTERFMRTPKENNTGYEDNSPVNFAKLMKGNYLLIHGSGDDNVHYQNAMEMINALVKANKQFDMFIYPNRNHGIYGGNTRNHLFNLMLNYILEKL